MRTILFISTFIIIIPIVYGSTLFKKFDKTIKLFFFFLALNLFVDIIALISAYMFKYNLIVYNISQFFKVNLVVFLFHSFQDIKLKKFNILFLIPFFIIIWIIFYSTGMDSIWTYGSFSSLIAIFSIIFFGIRYIVILSSSSKIIIYKSHYFWLLNGIIGMYLLSSILVILFLFISIYELVNVNLISIINNIISLICYILAFYFYNKQFNENSQLQKSNS